MACQGPDTVTREELANAIVNYFYMIVIDGDWQNDWLCHMPDKIALPVISLGHLLDTILTVCNCITN